MLSHFCKAKCDGIGIGGSLFSEDKLVREGVDILVSTNVRFSRMLAKKKLSLTCTDWIVIDEVDTLFESNFHKTSQLIEDVLKPNCNKHLKIIFSSTTNPQSLSQYLHKAFPSLTQVVDKKVHINLENIKHEFMQSQSYDKHQPLLGLLHRERNTKTMIFCNTVQVFMNWNTIYVSRASRLWLFIVNLANQLEEKTMNYFGMMKMVFY